MMRVESVRKLSWGAVALAVVAAAAWALKPQPVAVEATVAARGPLKASVSAEGRTRVKDLFVVAASVDGHLERVTVQPGDDVQADAVVAEIRPAASRPLDPRSRAQALAAVDSARAAVARAAAGEREAEAARLHAESLFERARSLAESGAGPRGDAEHGGHELDIRRRSAEAASAATRAARAELARATAALGQGATAGSQTVGLRAPVAGKVLRVLRESAGPVAAGTPLLEVGALSELEVEADLLSSDAALVRGGANATVTGWGGTQSIAARVRRIDPAAFTKVSALGLEEQRVRVILDLAGVPPAGLGHGYRVDVAVVVWEGKDVLRVPSTALFRVGERWAVFVVRDGRARRALVGVGAGDGTWTVVANGLREGDPVVTQPSDLLADGTRVRVRD